MFEFLSDEDPQTRKQVLADLRRLCAEDPERMKRLSAGNSEKTARLTRDIFEDIHWDALEEEFKKMGSARSFDLEKAILLLSSFADPEFKAQDVARRLDEMAAELRRIFTGKENPAEVVQTFNHYLFHNQGFRGNHEDYYNPDNSYFHRVLARKIGIPITLSCLYLFLGKRLSIPFIGIGLPGHFIIEFKSPEGGFYIDPFHNGQILTLEDCKEMLKQQKIPYNKKYFNPATNRAVMARTLANLIGVYSDREDRRKSGRLVRFLEFFHKDHQ